MYNVYMYECINRVDQVGANPPPFNIDPLPSLYVWLWFARSCAARAKGVTPIHVYVYMNDHIYIYLLIGLTQYAEPPHD